LTTLFIFFKIKISKRPKRAKGLKGVITMLILFTLPADFASTSLAYIGSYFTDLKEPLFLIVGTAMFMWVGGWIVGKITSRGRTRG